MQAERAIRCYSTDLCVRWQISQEFHGVDKWIRGEVHAVNNASGARESASEVVCVRRRFTRVARLKWTDFCASRFPAAHPSYLRLWSRINKWIDPHQPAGPPRFFRPVHRLTGHKQSTFTAVNSRRLRPASTHEVLDQSLRRNQSWKWCSSFQITATKFYCI